MTEQSAFEVDDLGVENKKNEPAQSQSTYVPQDKNANSANAGSLGTKEKTEYEKMLEAQMEMYPDGLLDESQEMHDLGQPSNQSAQGAYINGSLPN